jgi:hypothetical protein
MRLLPDGAVVLIRQINLIDRELVYVNPLGVIDNRQDTMSLLLRAPLIGNCRVHAGAQALCITMDGVLRRYVPRELSAPPIALPAVSR